MLSGDVCCLRGVLSRRGVLFRRCAVWVMYCPESVAEGVCSPGGPRGCAVEGDVLSRVGLVTMEGAFQRGCAVQLGVCSPGRGVLYKECAVQGVCCTRSVLSIT